MYQTIDLLPELIPEAERFVIDNDRELYRPFFTALEKWCIEENVLIGGRMGVQLLTGEPIDKDSYKWELYMESPFVMGKKLADLLYAVESPHISSKFISLLTNIKNRELTIAINTQLLVKLYGLDRGRGFRMTDAVGGTTRPGFFTGEMVRCVPEELQLVEVYKKLYSPASCKEWPALLDVEAALSNHHEKSRAGGDETGRDNGIADSQSIDIGDYITGGNDDSSDDDNSDDESGSSSDDESADDDWDAASGGSDDEPDKKPKKTGGRRERKQRRVDNKFSLRKIEQIIVEVIADKSGSLIVGDYALAAAGISPLPRQPRLALLTDISVDELAKQIAGAIRDSMPNLRPAVTHREHPLNLPTDFQIRKHTLYIAIAGEKTVSIADVYNSPAYELIPVVSGAPRSGALDLRSFAESGAARPQANPWVLLRFRYIELWVIKIISYIDNNPVWADKMKYLNESIMRLRRHAFSLPIESLFEMNYIGVFTIEAAAKKKYIKDIGERYAAYMPAAADKK